MSELPARKSPQGFSARSGTIAGSSVCYMWWQRWDHVADSSSGRSTSSTYIRQHAGGGRRSTGRDLRREDEPGQRRDNEDVAQAEGQQEEYIEVTRWTIGCAQRGGAARHATASSKGRGVALEFGYRELMAVDGHGVAFSAYVDSEATRHNKQVYCRTREEECGRLDSTLSNVLIYCSSVCGI